jgi:c-di-GMP-binding flagellar brake protein YcgR
MEEQGQGRRSQYRVELTDSTDLSMTVPNPDGAPFAGRLVDVSASGAGAMFDSADCPKLAVGQSVDLTFSSGDLPAPLTIAATVQHRAEGDGTRRYGFRFLQPQQLDAHLPPEMRQLFNRRRTVRVDIDMFDPMTAALSAKEGDDAAVDAQLHDLSTHGVRVSLETELERRFAETTSVALRIQLDSRLELNLVGNIRYRRLVGDRIHYGIEFDADRCQSFRRQQGIIARHVVKRRLKNLRKSA